MLEFLIALLIFSIGMLGLLATQLSGKKASYEAAQRSVATALARDIVERMQGNPAYVDAYTVRNAGDVTAPIVTPAADCNQSDCTAGALAAFDLWQWSNLLQGVSARHPGAVAGGLVSPRACISNDNGVVTVIVTWLGMTFSGNALFVDCGGVDVTETTGEGTAGNTRVRRHLVLTTYIPER
jgi:type IV pilus assembly protein PilV